MAVLWWLLKHCSNMGFFLLPFPFVSIYSLNDVTHWQCFCKARKRHKWLNSLLKHGMDRMMILFHWTHYCFVSTAKLIRGHEIIFRGNEKNDNIISSHDLWLLLRLANRGRLLLRTPDPVPFWTCICSNVETILSWTCHVYGPFEFRISLGTSILLSTNDII